MNGYLRLAILLLYVTFCWACNPSKRLSAPEIKALLSKTSMESKIQAEVDALFTYYGDKHLKILYDDDLKTSPALVQFAKILNGQITGIWPEGHFKNAPGCVAIRFGDHDHYQLVMIFGTGTDPSKIITPFEKINDYIYFLP